MMPFAAFAANSFIAAIWPGLLLSVAVGLVLRLLPGISAAVRWALWSAVFALTIVLHFEPAMRLPAAPEKAMYHAGAGWSVVLLAAWVLLTTYRAVQLALGAVHLRGLARRATPVRSVASAGHLGRAALLCTSAEVDRPSVIGFLRPRILIPPALLAAVTETELEHILLHEISHLRRGDDWTNLLQKLALVVFPLNPVLLWVERRLCRERELACDDLVLAATQAPKAYASCLASLAEHAAVRRTLSLALGAWGRQPELSARVHRILNRPKQTLSRIQTAAVAAAVVAGLGFGAERLAGGPQLVSFGRVAPPMTATALPEAAIGLAAPVSAKAMLAKAAMPQIRDAAARPAALRCALGSQRSRTPSLPKRAGVGRPAPLRAQQPGMVLTITRTVSAPPARRVSEMQGRRLSTPVFVPIAAYAVPTADGWLIIQL